MNQPSIPYNADAPIIVARDVNVRFGQQDVLRDLNVSIDRGETVAIIGESGCGKTVFLKTLIALVRPIDGDIVFDGQNLAELNDKELTRQRMRIGLVFQNAALFDSMTIGENVAFPLRQHMQLDKSEVERLVRERLEEVGLPESVVSKKPVELSGGMRKRVGLARALVMNPEVVLYDEPTTGLDPIVSDVINELILRTRQQRPVTSIVVTHDMRTAHKVADRVIMLFPLARLADDESQLIFDGSPDELDHCADDRVGQFVRGEAGPRLTELRGGRAESDDGSISMPTIQTKRAA